MPVVQSTRFELTINRKTASESDSGGDSGFLVFGGVGEEERDNGGGEFEMDADSFGSDAGDADGGADSFG